MTHSMITSATGRTTRPSTGRITGPITRLITRLITGRVTVCSPARTPIRSAFSLIEVLLATAILLVALLGVAAVFPRVLLTQQNAARSVSSLTQEAEARSALLARDSTGPEFWFDWASQAAAGDITTQGVVTMPLLTNRTADNPVTGCAQLRADGSWFIPYVSASPRSLYSGTRLTGSLPVPAGGLVLGTILQGSQVRFNTQVNDPSYDRDMRVVIPLRERLRLDSPSAAYTTGSVWDIAVRRVAPHDFRGNIPADSTAGNLGFDGRVQIAMFVRPLDPRLSIVPGEAANAVKTIRQALYNGVTASGGFDALLPAEKRLPVSAFADGAGPALDGLFEGRLYSNLMKAFVSPDGLSAQLLRVSAIYGADLALTGVRPTANTQNSPFATLIRLMRTPGQMLVDANGNIHEVAAYRAGDPDNSVRLTKPATAFVLGEVVFSPQKPSRVNVFVVSPGGQ